MMSTINRNSEFCSPLPRSLSAKVIAHAFMLLAILITSNMAACGGVNSPPMAKDETEVRKVFEAFRSAVVTKNTSAAAALVSKAGFKHAAHIQELALYAPREVLEAEPISAEMYVLMLRMSFTAQQLKTMQPAEVLAFGVEKGFIGNLWQADDQLQGFRFLSSDMGKGQRIRHQTPVGAPVQLVREGFKTWRVDILPELAMLDKNMRSLAKARNLSERTVARAVVEFQSMKPLQPRYFDPLFPPKTAQLGGA